MQIAWPARNNSLRAPFSRFGERPTPRLRLPSALQLLTIGIVGLASLPLAYRVSRAPGGGPGGLDCLLGARALEVVGNSRRLWFAVVGAAALSGVPFAWLTARTALPFRRLWLVAGLLTLVIPSYIGTMMFIAAF